MFPIPSQQNEILDAVYYGQLSARNGWFSASAGKALADCPARLLVERPDTEALKLGRVCHLAVLQPGRFQDLYYRAPDVPRVKKEDKELHALAAEANGTKLPLKAADWDLVTGIGDAVWGSKPARELITAASQDIPIIVGADLWRCAETGVLCKSKPDLAGNGIIVDLKTAAKLTDPGFTRDFYNYGYDTSAAHYLDAPFGYERYVFICVEKTAQALVRVIELSTPALSRARDRIMRQRLRFADVTQSRNFHGYPDYEIFHGPSWEVGSE